MSLSKSQQNIATMLAKAGRKVTTIDATDPSKPPIVKEPANHRLAEMELEYDTFRRVVFRTISRMANSDPMFARTNNQNRRDK